MIYDLLFNVNGSTNHSPGPRSSTILSSTSANGDEGLLFGGLTRLTSGEQSEPNPTSMMQNKCLHTRTIVLLNLNHWFDPLLTVIVGAGGTHDGWLDVTNSLGCEEKA